MSLLGEHRPLFSLHNSKNTLPKPRNKINRAYNNCSKILRYFGEDNFSYTQKYILVDFDLFL